jgi:hypothetical protein
VEASINGRGSRGQDQALSPRRERVCSETVFLRRPQSAPTMLEIR